MDALALIFYVVYLALAFGVRTLIQVRRTGSTGFHGVGGRPGSPEWIAGVGFVVALVVGVAAPVLALLGVVEPIDALDTTAAHAAGIVLAVVGIGATLYAQVAMGTSWRIGVDPTERTSLVTDGPFAVVRGGVRRLRRSGRAVRADAGPPSQQPLVPPRGFEPRFPP
jgi:protein-S-isoprenylcysteine O-methyltransferase Ste14